MCFPDIYRGPISPYTYNDRLRRPTLFRFKLSPLYGSQPGFISACFRGICWLPPLFRQQCSEDTKALRSLKTLDIQSYLLRSDVLGMLWWSKDFLRKCLDV